MEFILLKEIISTLSYHHINIKKEENVSSFHKIYMTIIKEGRLNIIENLHQCLVYGPWPYWTEGRK